MNKRTDFVICNMLVYGLPIAIISILPYSTKLFGTFQSLLFNLLLAHKVLYSPLGLIFDFLFLYCLFVLIFKKEFNFEEERVYLIYSGLEKVARYVFVNNLKKPTGITEKEKVSLLFYCVKIIFTPVMVNFLIGNSTSMWQTISRLSTSGPGGNIILDFILPLLFHFILVLDTIIFTFGYLIESAALKNIVKSVEPTAFGWLVALLCYPPFNTLTGNVFGWYSSDFSDFGSVNINVITGVISIALFAVYVWASVALGFKASNLTNRGIVGHGPYKYVRHPAYTAKNLSWWIMGIPFIKTASLAAIISLSAWTLIYYLRAMTEENHLSKDPDYITYMKKVPYMFIPGIL